MSNDDVRLLRSNSVAETETEINISALQKSVGKLAKTVGTITTQQETMNTALADMQKMLERLVGSNYSKTTDSTSSKVETVEVETDLVKPLHQSHIFLITLLCLFRSIFLVV